MPWDLNFLNIFMFIIYLYKTVLSFIIRYKSIKFEMLGLISSKNSSEYLIVVVSTLIFYNGTFLLNVCYTEWHLMVLWCSRSVQTWIIKTLRLEVTDDKVKSQTRTSQTDIPKYNWPNSVAKHWNVRKETTLKLFITGFDRFSPNLTAFNTEIGRVQGSLLPRLLHPKSTFTFIRPWYPVFYQCYFSGFSTM